MVMHLTVLLVKTRNFSTSTVTAGSSPHPQAILCVDFCKETTRNVLLSVVIKCIIIEESFLASRTQSIKLKELLLNVNYLITYKCS